MRKRFVVGSFIGLLLGGVIVTAQDGPSIWASYFGKTGLLVEGTPGKEIITLQGDTLDQLKQVVALHLGTCHAAEFGATNEQFKLWSNREDICKQATAYLIEAVRK